jgi:hypothetical protein
MTVALPGRSILRAGIGRQRGCEHGCGNAERGADWNYVKHETSLQAGSGTNH